MRQPDTERLAELARRFNELQARLADPAVVADQDRYAALARQFAELEPLVGCGRRIGTVRADLDAARELLREADPEEREALEREIEARQSELDQLEAQFAVLARPRDPNDQRNVIVEIRGAEGGEEANLFARDLFEMYRAFVSAHGWRIEVLGSSPSALGGYSEITFRVIGEGAWSSLRFEGGPHRVQRVPVTESAGRIHTSSATVSVLPEADEVDVALDPADLDIQTFRATGPGGQSVNTTDSAVRIIHRPTGLVVSMQDEKSQLQNKAKALTVLRSRLLRLEQQRRAAEQSSERRAQIGGGGRAEKIRTYNFKENRVTDHRVGLTLHKLDKVLAGDLDDLVDALAAAEGGVAGSGTGGR